MRTRLMVSQLATLQSDPTGRSFFPVGTDPPGGPTCPRGRGANEMRKRAFHLPSLMQLALRGSQGAAWQSNPTG